MKYVGQNNIEMGEYYQRLPDMSWENQSSKFIETGLDKTEISKSKVTADTEG